MATKAIFERIKEAINAAPRNGYVAELHLQVLKYSDALVGVTGRDFCEGVGIGPSFGTEYSKMRKIAARLKDAGLDVNKI